MESSSSSDEGDPNVQWDSVKEYAIGIYIETNGDLKATRTAVKKKYRFKRK